MNLSGLLARLPWQTMDNNKSWKNKKENLKISQELADRGLQLMDLNLFKTKTIIKNHIVDWSYENCGEFIPNERAEVMTKYAIEQYRSCGFIDEWNNIREDLLEFLTK